MFKILAYGLPALPLGSLYFSIYVLIGEFYFVNYGLALSVIGLIFIIIRLFDAFTDPIMGYISDNFPSRFGKRKPWVLIGGTVFIFSTWMLFVPINQSVDVEYFFFWLLISAIGWTVAYAPYYALGAELSMDYLERSKVTFCRELFTILGIIFASLLYSISFDFNKLERDMHNNSKININYLIAEAKRIKCYVRNHLIFLLGEIKDVKKE